MTTPPLPPGFVLDSEPTQAAPPLPPGFVLDAPAPSFAHVTGRFSQAAEPSNPFLPPNPLTHPREFAQDIGRVAGMGARGLAEGAAGFVDFIGGPVRYAAEKLTGQPQATYSEFVDQGADKLGLPEPQTRFERGVQAVNRGLGGTALTMGGGALAAPLEGAAGNVGRFFAAAPVSQVVATTAGSLAANEAKEQGAGPGTQFLAGLLGGMAPFGAQRAFSAVGSAAENTLGRFTTGGAQRQAARKIVEEAGGNLPGGNIRMAGVMTSRPSQVDGVRRTLAEESQNPGVARLERQMRGQDKSGAFVDIDRANNEARLAAIRKFAGDDAAIEAAEQARDAKTGPLLDKALAPKVDAGEKALREALGLSAVGKVNVRPIYEAVKIGEGQRAAVKSAMGDIRKELDRFGTTPAGLYNVRKTIGDLLSGKAGADKGYAKAAARELIGIRNIIDDEIAKVSPEFKEYLTAYQEASRGVNRMQLGQQLIEKGSSANRDGLTGNEILLPAQFNRQVRDLDRAAQQATGFNKARAADILQPEDAATIAAIHDDMNRIASRATLGSGGGSHTSEQQRLGESLAQSALNEVPLVNIVAKPLNRGGNERVMGQISYLLQNPGEFRRVAAKLTPKDREALSNILARLSGAVGGGVQASNNISP